jgi:AraC-like DNA-binding protein
LIAALGSCIRGSALILFELPWNRYWNTRAFLYAEKMLRALHTLTHEAVPGALIAADDDRAVLKGGGGGYSRPWHWHDCFMFLLPATGAMELRVEEQPTGFWLSEDRFAVVPSNRAHESSTARDNSAHVAIYLTSSALSGIERKHGSLSRFRAQTKSSAVFAATPQIRTLQRLCREDDSNEFASIAVRRQLSAALLLSCLSQSERTEALPTASPSSHGAALIAEVKSFVADHAAKEFSLDQLSERFGVSRRHITRLFREHTGVSIGEFQKSERLMLAKRLLAETELAVGEIAFRVGFESGTALARIMRRSEGFSPLEVRAMARSAKR